MKQICFSLFTIAILCSAVSSQSRTNQIFRRCSGSTATASVQVRVGGDIYLQPCSTKKVFFGSGNTFGFDFTPTNSNGTFNLGDTSNGNQFGIFGNEASPNISINVNNAGGSISMATNGFNNAFTLADTAFFSGSIQTQLGTSASRLQLNASTDVLSTTLGTWDLSDAGGAGFGVATFKFLRTVTAGGTTGNQTINKPIGSVNFAAGANTITITNSTVNANSLIFAMPQRLDATCTVFQVDAVGSGSFNIHSSANCTAETRVAFFVSN